MREPARSRKANEEIRKGRIQLAELIERLEPKGLTREKLIEIREARRNKRECA